MKMYETYEASREAADNKYLGTTDNRLLSYYLPNEYYAEREGNENSIVEYMTEYQGSLNCIDSTATSKQLIFKTDPDEDADDWKVKELKDWTNNDVLHWIASVAETQSFPYEFINATAFNVDGKTLLSLSKKEFMDSDEKYGGILYQALHKALPLSDEISSGGCETKSEVKTEVKLETLSTPARLTDALTPLVGKQSSKGGGDGGGGTYGFPSGTDGDVYSRSLDDPLEPYPFDLNAVKDEPEEAPERCKPLRDRKNSETNISSSDVEQSDSESKKQVMKKSGTTKRSPGRPPGLKTKKEKPEKKTGRLWEFIRDLLLDPQHCPSVICWENHDDGVFRFVKSEKVAKIWGDRKGNEKMNYEKLSRAMRYYYRSKVLQPVLGRRLVYKFGPTARGWKTENPNFRH